METVTLVAALMFGGAVSEKSEAAFSVETRFQAAQFDLKQWVADGVVEDCEQLFDTVGRLDWDLETVQIRLQELRLNAPSILDRHALPHHEFAYAQYERAGEFIRWCEGQLDYSGPVERQAYELLIWETRWRRTAWELIADANWPTYIPRHGRRVLLQRLRDHIGTKAYDNFDYPDPLPAGAAEMYSVWAPKPFPNYGDEP